MRDIFKKCVVGLAAVLVLVAAGVAGAEDTWTTDNWTVYAVGQHLDQKYSDASLRTYSTNVNLVGVGVLKRVFVGPITAIQVEALTGTAKHSYSRPAESGNYRFTGGSWTYLNWDEFVAVAKRYESSAFKVGGSLGFELSKKITGVVSGDVLDAGALKSHNVTVKIGYTF